MSALENARATLVTLIGNRSIDEADLANIQALIVEHERVAGALSRESASRVRAMYADAKLAHNLRIRAERAEAELESLRAASS